MKKHLAWLDMRGWFIPSLLHDIIEAGDPNPKVLELERPRCTWATDIGKKKRAMVRQG
jgi:hypothetical protein